LCRKIDLDPHEDNIEMDLKQIGCEDVNRMQVAEDVQWRAVVNTAMNSQVL
jgi:hypothetical protein